MCKYWLICIFRWIINTIIPYEFSSILTVILPFSSSSFYVCIFPLLVFSITPFRLLVRQYFHYQFTPLPSQWPPSTFLEYVIKGENFPWACLHSCTQNDLQGMLSAIINWVQSVSWNQSISHLCGSLHFCSHETTLKFSACHLFQVSSGVWAVGTAGEKERTFLQWAWVWSQ